MKTLKESLQDWSDIDTSMMHLAHALGMLEPQESGPKWMYWSANPAGDVLGEILASLQKIGVLEFREDGPTDEQFRWNPNYLPPS